MDAVVAGLREQADELDAILRHLDDAQWGLPTRCPGWSVADVVLHLAQTDAYAAASARGAIVAAAPGSGWAAPGPGDETVDDVASALVDAERGAAPAEIHARWRHASRDALDALAACAPSARVQWVAGDLAARTLASTRLSECWIHTGDVADAVGVELAPTARLWHVARLAHRTLPYAFARAGRTLHGPVVFRVTSPVDPGEEWTFGARGLTTVTGPARDLCLVAGRRADPSRTALRAWGPDADAVLALVRTFA